jgi:hypothetical protein
MGISRVFPLPGYWVPQLCILNQENESMLYAAKVIGKRIEADRVVDAIRSDLATLRETLALHYANLPRPGYALPMAWRCAVEMSNKLIDVIPRYASADHGSVFKALLAVARGILRVPGSEFAGPRFDLAIEHDEAVQSCLDGEYHLLSYLNLEISLRADHWRLLYDADDDSFRLSLAPPQRRSALVLVDHKAELLWTTPEVREILSSASSVNENKTIPLVLATGMREVAFLADALPNAWRELAGRIGFTLDEGVRFQAFIQALMNRGDLWFRSEDLLETLTNFAKARSLAPIAEHQFHRLVDFFSAPPEAIESWGIAVPFVRFGDWLAYWPFVHHVLPPSLTFLSLLMRKHPDAWNNTVGADLAKVADAIRGELPNTPGLLFATTKKKAGVGDIDLGIYEPRSRVLLLCEIKTVFDRFRTNYQQSNFTDQRVNFDKAEKQLAAAGDAIESGVWQLSEIFDRTLHGPPAQILSLVLTWYDQHDPWLGIEPPNPANCNFRVFQHLFTQAGGDLVMLHEAIVQLSRIYCVAALPSWRLPIMGEAVAVKRETQTDLLPPQEVLDEMPLSDVVRREIEPLAKLPADWEAQLTAIGQGPRDYHIYGFDEQ